MFTRQHYKAIAEILEYYENSPFFLDTVKGIADKLADYFAADNSRFDREQFLQACGL